MLLKRPCAAPGVSLHVGVNGRILLRIRERAAYALLTLLVCFGGQQQHRSSNSSTTAEASGSSQIFQTLSYYGGVLPFLTFFLICWVSLILIGLLLLTSSPQTCHSNFSRFPGQAGCGPVAAMGRRG